MIGAATAGAPSLRGFGGRTELSPTTRVSYSGLALSDDGPLIEATLAGESAAFGQLVRKYQDRLYNTLAHLTGRPEDARDLVQDAFVQAFVKLETFKRQSGFYTWLYRIAFNLAATTLRRRRRTVSVEAARESSGQEPIEPGEGPHQRLEQDERCRQVQEAIAQLGDEYRSVLVLREMEGCSYERIAEILDLPVGTVRSRLHRARAQLRDQLEEVLSVEP
ncbi:MAG: sigma-70 family RNA polymerase sigma factor [Pirellulales bacterium]|nr:sigma-70 family RNA polymerase sigma factor [Pirellulales bacterium]